MRKKSIRGKMRSSNLDAEYLFIVCQVSACALRL